MFRTQHLYKAYLALTIFTIHTDLLFNLLVHIYCNHFNLNIYLLFSINEVDKNQTMKFLTIDCIFSSGFQTILFSRISYYVLKHVFRSYLNCWIFYHSSHTIKLLIPTVNSQLVN